MNIEDVISKLNWFYSLELNQVDLYKSQSKFFKDTYHSKVFEHISYREQQHVDNIAEKIKELGGTPSVIGNVIAPIIGKLGGKVVSLTGLEDTLKINILLEEKAKKDYEDFIQGIKTENSNVKNKNNKENNSIELLKVLGSNYIDEDMHNAWFKGYLTKFEGGNKYV